MMPAPACSVPGGPVLVADPGPAAPGASGGTAAAVLPRLGQDLGLESEFLKPALH